MLLRCDKRRILRGQLRNSVRYEKLKGKVAPNNSFYCRAKCSLLPQLGMTSKAVPLGDEGDKHSLDRTGTQLMFNGCQTFVIEIDEGEILSLEVRRGDVITVQCSRRERFGACTIRARITVDRKSRALLKTWTA